MTADFFTCAENDENEGFIKMSASEHLKHAPQIQGGGGHGAEGYGADRD